MTRDNGKSELTTPTGEFEFKIRGFLSEQVNREKPRSLKRLLGLVEKNIIVDVLQHVNGNQRKAGRILGLKSTTLNAKLKKYGIQVFRRIGIHSLSGDSIVPAPQENDEMPDLHLPGLPTGYSRPTSQTAPTSVTSNSTAETRTSVQKRTEPFTNGRLQAFRPGAPASRPGMVFA